MKYPILSLLFLALLTVSACKTGKRATTGKLKPKSEKFLMKRLVSNQVNAEWLSAKAKITYRDEYGRETLSSNIRIRKDSLIWMNFKKFGLEGGRALITPDSIFLIDRLNGQYVAKPFEFAQREYRLPVNFQGLQAMMLGNPVFFSSQTEAGVDSTRYLLTQRTDQLNASYWLDGAKMLLQEIFIEDFRNSRSISVQASDYQKLPDNQNFSYFRRVNLSSNDLGEMQVDLDFSKVEINVPKKTPFRIPEHYERMD